jgi:hypothetical protein
MSMDIVVLYTVGITHKVGLGIARTLGSAVVVTIPYNCVRTHVMKGAPEQTPSILWKVVTP